VSTAEWRPSSSSPYLDTKALLLWAPPTFTHSQAGSKAIAACGDHTVDKGFCYCTHWTQEAVLFIAFVIPYSNKQYR